jgi:tetratricopeptide (TPR) repeat protein
MSINTASNLFITSSFKLSAGFYQQLISGMSSFQELGNKVVKIAEQAQAFRQYDKVKEAAQLLTNIPIKHYQTVGHYYLGLCEVRKGKSPKEIFERVAENAPAKYRALAMQSLAAIEARKQDYESELYWFAESLEVHPSSEAFIGIAVVKAKEGDHKHALKDLERFYPLARYAPPHIYFAYLNSLAIELGEAGRKYEARNVIKHVLESPFIIAYPEWQETAEDLRGPNRSFAVIDPSPLKPRNVLSMPAFERDGAEFPAWAGQPAQIVTYQELKRRMGKKKKGNGKRKAEDMDVRDMMFRIMEIYCNNQTSDEQRVKMWEAVEKIAANEPAAPEPPDDEGPDDHKPGA